MAEKPYLTCIEEIFGKPSEAKQIRESQKPLLAREVFPELEEAMEISPLQIHESQKPLQNGFPKIQKVDPYLRERENSTKHFSPLLVSMGPIHHRNKNLKLGEQLKLMWAKNYLHRTKPTPETRRDLYNKIAGDIENLKNQFTDDAIEGFTNEELSVMLFVDGCSLLEILDKFSCGNLDELNIRLHQRVLVAQDVLLLENQLPYEVLRLLSSIENEAKVMESMKIFIETQINLVVTKANNQQQEQTLDIDPGDPNKESAQQKEPPVHLLGLMYRTILAAEKSKDQEPTKDSALQQVHKLANLLVQAARHLQPLLRTILCQSNTQKAKEQGQRQKESDGDNVTYRNIRELKEAGIKVKTSKSPKLREISFNSGWFGGELKLPQLVVDDATAPIFLNLIAYEMCPDFDNDYGISTFVTFLDSLIDYPDDVKELRRSGVLINLMGSDEEVAKLFNTISTDLVPNFDIVPYSDIRPAIERHYGDKWITWLTLGYHSYFSNPWSVMNFYIAVIALVLAVIQIVLALP